VFILSTVKKKKRPNSPIEKSRLEGKTVTGSLRCAGVAQRKERGQEMCQSSFRRPGLVGRGSEKEVNEFYEEVMVLPPRGKGRS